MTILEPASVSGCLEVILREVIAVVVVRILYFICFSKVAGSGFEISGLGCRV